MESSLSIGRLISATRSNFFVDYRLLSVRVKRIEIPHNHFMISAKRLASQDFSDYAKPLQLLPVTKPETCSIDTFTNEENLTASIRSDCCLYKVRLSTSKLYGSDLSDLNAGILLCLMNGNGDAILQRFSAGCSSLVSDDILHFRRGSVDDFTFNGPILGNIEAVWLSVESGQWRLAGLNVTVVRLLEEEERCYTCLEYGFDLEDDILLGEGIQSSSMVELRPSAVSEFTSNDFTRLCVGLEYEYASLGISNEESMKEYSDLKSTLLLYNTLLVLFGSTISFIVVGEDVGLAFLTGGIGGFIYLLFLQRSVDGLGNNNSNDQEFKVTLSGLILLLLSVAFVTAKYGASTNTAMLTAKEVVFGMMGFLACKIAAVLAAFRPFLTEFKRKN
ncbi:uncharacterized protein LOC124911362 [Impatiens glandulifera]|uniref:uncharacterized protein LOC124911362 n=1 Tax=Impatiens glandulifera TaxID=253017 RepID=UPI001FB10D3E|nr:uncharacterized protein LOC124911362 [Impatiens glandulifera]